MSTPDKLRAVLALECGTNICPPLIEQIVRDTFTSGSLPKNKYTEEPALPLDFARVKIGPGAWVITAENLQTYALGKTYGKLSLAKDLAGAAVFHAEKAREIAGNLHRLFPAVELQPATFAEWVEQQAG